MAGVDDDIMKTRTTFLLGNIKLNSLHIGLDFVKCLRLKIFLLDAFYVLFFWFIGQFSLLMVFRFHMGIVHFGRWNFCVLCVFILIGWEYLHNDFELYVNL